MRSKMNKCETCPAQADCESHVRCWRERQPKNTVSKEIAEELKERHFSEFLGRIRTDKRDELDALIKRLEGDKIEGQDYIEELAKHSLPAKWLGEMVICPFCKESGFNSVGLEHHLHNYCKAVPSHR